MKIIIPTFERIEWMPPTINMLKELDRMGYEIIVVTLFPSKYLSDMNLNNVSQLSLALHDKSLQPRIRYIKGISGTLYRLDLMYKKFLARKLKNVIKKIYSPSDILWIVNEMTVTLGGGNWLKKYKYLFTIYELHEPRFRNRYIINAARYAEKVIVPQYCRAHIMKFWYNLQRLPLIIPNKSEVFLPDESLSLPNYVNDAIEKINKLKDEGKFLLVYMGIISNERPLDNILKTISGQSQYHLLLMGRETEYLNILKQNYSESLTYLGHFLPPYHLGVSRYADAGILVYVPSNKSSGLNALFCAPNKIWEYTGLGLPIIANDIPGLKYEVEYSNIGRCVDFSSEKEIGEALTKIRCKKDEYTAAAEKYYKSLDTSMIYEQIIKSIQVGK